MECPNCNKQLTELVELSRGMGNQTFFECRHCGTVVLCSGKLITQSWLPTNGHEGGSECHLLGLTVASTNVS